MAERGWKTEGDAQREAGNSAAGRSAETDVSGRDAKTGADGAPDAVEEIGGPKGPEPTRYGDWEKGGRCSDF